jgi:hypothetical protein
VGVCSLTTFLVFAGVIVPFSPSDALVNGSVRPAEVQDTLHRAFYRLVAVAGVACVLTAGVGIHVFRSRRT